MTHFDQPSKDHKIITRGRRHILRPDLESPWSIFSENKFFSTKSLIFDAFLEPKRYIAKKVGFWCWNWGLPFWFLKGPNSKLKLGDRKYGVWAFQNRSQNVSATSRSIFRIPFVPYSFSQNKPKSRFLPKMTKIHQIIKIDLRVAAIFWDRFWKAESPYFRFLEQFWDDFHFFTPFRNQNGNFQSLIKQIGNYRFGS